MSRLKSKYSNILKEPDSYSSEEEDQYDSGVIRCVCDDPSDDGFTIQCEHCLDWQHASCVNIKRSRIPKHYLCDRCSRLLKKKHPLEFLNRSKELKEKKKHANRKYSFEEMRQENLSKGFTHITQCIVKQKTVANIFKEVRQYWFQINKLKTPVKLDATTIKGLESLVIMESNLLLPSIPKASVKPLRRSLRGAFINNEKNLFADKGVFADIHIPKNRYLMEIIGEIKLKSEYKTSNYYSLLGTPLRHVFFYHSLDTCIDAREFGNDSRFIRRSCKPNSEIKSIILPNDNDDLIIHMGVYTTEELDKGEEVTIGWNWQRGLDLYKKYQEFLLKDERYNSKKSPTEPDIKNKLKKIIRLLETEYGECGCEDKDECFIEYIKDQLEAESDSDITEPMQIVKKKKRPGRPRLSDSTKTIPMSSSDEEHKLKSRKRTCPEESEPPPKKAPAANENIMKLKEQVTPPRMLFGKKKWLQIYLSQQKGKGKYAVSEKDDCNNYFSDASSESTLPLTDDTREVTFNKIIQKDYSINNSKQKEDDVNLKYNIEQPQEQIKENTEDIAPPESSNKPTPRVKLSIQEYLSMRRNLSTN